jgi:hypothetical protein
MVKTYEAQILKDGHLSVAEDVLSEMNLQSGERVEITIRRFHADELDALSDNPLAEIIGMCGNIGKTDSSVNHDYYLYVEDKP